MSEYEKKLVLEKIAGELSLIRRLIERSLAIKEYEHRRDREMDEKLPVFPPRGGRVETGIPYGSWGKAGEHIDHE